MFSFFLNKTNLKILKVILPVQAGYLRYKMPEIIAPIVSNFLGNRGKILIIGYHEQLKAINDTYPYIIKFQIYLVLC